MKISRPLQRKAKILWLLENLQNYKDLYGKPLEHDRSTASGASPWQDRSQGLFPGLRVGKRVRENALGTRLRPWSKTRYVYRRLVVLARVVSLF